MHDTTVADRRALHARRATLLASLLVFAGLAAGVGAKPAAYWPSRPVDEAALAGAVLTEVAAPTSIEQLRARILEVLEREGVPGVGLALVDRDGIVWAGGVGVADRETGRPVDADTQFRVASITKSLVALGVMRLVEQGRLDLDQPLSTLMPEVAASNAWDRTSPITLAHALFYRREGMRTHHRRPPVYLLRLDAAEHRDLQGILDSPGFAGAASSYASAGARARRPGDPLQRVTLADGRPPPLRAQALRALPRKREGSGRTENSLHPR